jgi:hypothetical protein
VSVVEKNEGRKGRCVYIEGNNECRYLYSKKEGGKDKLVVTYACSGHRNELLFKDAAGYYLKQHV